MHTTTTSTAAPESTATFSALHPDIIETHILPLLDGPSLASTSCCSSALRRLSAHRPLWSHLCHSTWPSTTTSPLLRRVTSAQPILFFSQAYSTFPTTLPPPPSSLSSPPSGLISAVDISYRDNLIFSKVQETETETNWFKCSPFRIDMLDPKDVIPTDIKLTNDNVEDFGKHMTMSWLLIDPKSRRVTNLSSQQPVSVQRHWLTGEIQLKYAVIIGDVQCGLVLSCGGNRDHETNAVTVLREVSLEMEDIDGTHLNGRDSLEIIHRALRGKRGKVGKNRAGECKKKYGEYLEKKIERKERKVRTEWVLDMLCVAFGVFGFSVFVWFFVLRRSSSLSR